MYTSDNVELDVKLQAVADVAARIYSYIDTAQALANQIGALSTALEAADADLRKALGALQIPKPSAQATEDADLDAYNRLH